MLAALLSVAPAVSAQSSLAVPTNVSASSFVDAGNVWAGLRLSATNPDTGAYLGVRFQVREQGVTGWPARGQNPSVPAGAWIRDGTLDTVLGLKFATVYEVRAHLLDSLAQPVQASSGVVSVRTPDTPRSASVLLSTTLTSDESGNNQGCSSVVSQLDACSVGLSDDDLDYKGLTYKVWDLYVVNVLNASKLVLSFQSPNWRTNACVVPPRRSEIETTTASTNTMSPCRDEMWKESHGLVALQVTHASTGTQRFATSQAVYALSDATATIAGRVTTFTWNLPGRRPQATLNWQNDETAALRLLFATPGVPAPPTETFTAWPSSSWSGTLTVADVTFGLSRGSSAMATRKKKNSDGSYVSCTDGAGLATNEKCVHGSVYEKVLLNTAVPNDLPTAFAEGCRSDDPGNTCQDKLSPSSFWVSGVGTYNIESLVLMGGTLTLCLDRNMPELKSIALNVGNPPVSLGLSPSSHRRCVQWNNQVTKGLTWNDNDTVSLSFDATASSVTRPARQQSPPPQDSPPLQDSPPPIQDSPPPQPDPQPQQPVPQPDPQPQQQVQQPDPQPQQQQQVRTVALPDVVTDLTVTATASTVTVSWVAPTSGGTVDKYIVQLKAPRGEKGKHRKIDATKTTTTFRNLKAGVTYKIRVRSQNDTGKSKRTTQTITTPQAGLPER